MQTTHCFCSAGFEKWLACMRMRKVDIRIEKRAVAAASIIERLCHVKVPTMFSIAKCDH